MDLLTFLTVVVCLLLLTGLFTLTSGDLVSTSIVYSRDQLLVQRNRTVLPDNTPDSIVTQDGFQLVKGDRSARESGISST